MKMIDVTRKVLDFVIGRCGIGNTASSLWPCQTHSRGIYTTAVILNLFTFLQVGQVMGEEKAAPAAPLATTESPSANTPAPMTDIHDILPPVPVGIEAHWLVPVLIALVAAAILSAAWWLWK